MKDILVEKKKGVRITIISFEQYSDYEFIDPATFFIVDGMQNYVYIHTSKREVAQAWVDQEYTKGKYLVKASKLQKGNGKDLTCRG